MRKRDAWPLGIDIQDHPGNGQCETLRICMLSLANVQQPYGSTTRPLYLGNHLVRHGADVIHICEKLPPSEKGPKIISLQDYAEQSPKDWFPHLRKECRRFLPDLIYSHQVTPARMGLKLSRITKRVHVYDAHSSQAHELGTYKHLTLKERFWRIAQEAVVLKLVDKIIAPSTDLRDYFVKTYRINPDRIRVVKNGVETNVFCPAPPDLSLRERLGISPEAILVIFTNPRQANFPSNEMALRMLFELIPEIERKIPHMKFLILGGGPELKGPSPNIMYTGYVENLPAYLNLADICVAPYPSQAVCGGNRNKICEYLACGRPIIATREAMRGFEDAVSDEHYLLFENARDFVSKLEECVYDREKARKIGRNARKLSEKYSWSRLATEILTVFQEAMRM